jgi:hypothetical protein
MVKSRKFDLGKAFLVINNYHVVMVLECFRYVYSTHNGDDLGLPWFTTFFRVFSATFPPQLGVGLPPRAARIAKAWSKNMATAALSDGFVLACHKEIRRICAGVVNMSIKWWNLKMSVQFLFGKWGCIT